MYRWEEQKKSKEHEEEGMDNVVEDKEEGDSEDEELGNVGSVDNVEGPEDVANFVLAVCCCASVPNGAEAVVPLEEEALVSLKRIWMEMWAWEWHQSNKIRSDGGRTRTPSIRLAQHHRGFR